MMRISINICKLLALHSYHQMDADLHISFMFTSFRSCFIIIHKGRFHCSCKFFVGSSPSIHFNFYYLQFNSILQLTTAIVKLLNHGTGNLHCTPVVLNLVCQQPKKLSRMFIDMKCPQKFIYQKHISHNFC